MSNVIEEFVIKFLTDSKEAKKGAKEIDKLLDDVGKKQVKRATSNAKIENKAHSTMLAKKLKAEATYGRDSKLQADKARKAWERREKINSLMPTNKLSGKSAQTSAGVFEKSFANQAKESAKLSELDRKRWIDKQKRRASNARKKEDDRRKEEDSYRKSLNNRLKDFKASKQKERKFSESINKEAERIRGTAGYKLADRMGEGSKYDKEIQSLVDKRNIRGLQDMRKEMSDVNKNMTRYRRNLRKTNIAQKGLTDSTRNMIRSYASLYAIFEGTGAIKRVGMDFQGMEASMLAASGSTEAAAKDMMFINGLVDEMGLSLKDTTDAFVKFKFAAKGKISQKEQEDLFTGLSMFGTSMKVGTEDMKRAQRALTQIMSKGQVMAEELCHCFKTTFGSFQWKH